MPTFKVCHVDGSETELEAQRMSATDETISFERRERGDWSEVQQFTAEAVDVVRKRIVETNGHYRWITVRPRPLRR
ncbi:hypothetical protein [Nocardioides pakistanensis]